MFAWLWDGASFQSKRWSTCSVIFIFRDRLNINKWQIQAKKYCWKRDEIEGLTRFDLVLLVIQLAMLSSGKRILNFFRREVQKLAKLKWSGDELERDNRSVDHVHYTIYVIFVIVPSKVKENLNSEKKWTEPQLYTVIVASYDNDFRVARNYIYQTVITSQSIADQLFFDSIAKCPTNLHFTRL